MSDGNLFDDTNTRSWFIYGEGMVVWSREIVPFLYNGIWMVENWADADVSFQREASRVVLASGFARV